MEQPPIDVAKLQALLGPRWAKVSHFETVLSTQSELRRIFAEQSGVYGQWRLAVAEFQSAGRGRTGNAWHADKSTSILMTLGGRTALAPHLWPRASLAAGLALAQVLERAGVQARIKWPNDLLVLHDGRWSKVAGILCERVGGACGDSIWLCGIGVNVGSCDWPRDLAQIAISLQELGISVDRTELTGQIASAILQSIETWQQRAGRLDLLALEAKLAFCGDEIELDFGDSTAKKRAKLLGLDETGALRVAYNQSPSRIDAAQPLAITAAFGAVPWHARIATAQ